MMEKESYIQTFGSFFRNGNYPLEADYIFNSVEELKQWEEANKKYLHEGLLKIVIEEDKQILYWYYNDTFTPLIDSDSLESITFLLKDLDQESLRDLIKDLQSSFQSKLKAIQQELDQTQSGVGLNGDGTFDQINMKNTTYLDGASSVIEALKALDREMSNLVVDAFIQDAYYDTSTEELVLTFFTKQDKEKTVRISLTNLIREWEPDNSSPDKVVELTREEVLGGGADRLSADVRIWNDRRNILQKYGNTLGVDGSSDNITYNGAPLTSKLNEITNSTSDLDGRINTLQEGLDQANTNIQLEQNRAESAEQVLDYKVDQCNNAIDRIREIHTEVKEQVKQNTSDIEYLMGQLNPYVFNTYQDVIDANLLLGDIFYLKNTETVWENVFPEIPNTGYVLWIEDGTWWGDVKLYMWDNVSWIIAWPGQTSIASVRINDTLYRCFDFGVDNTGKEVSTIFNNGAGSQFDGPKLVIDSNKYLKLTNNSYSFDLSSGQEQIYYKGLYVVTEDGFKALSLDEEIKENLEGLIDRVDDIDEKVAKSFSRIETTRMSSMIHINFYTNDGRQHQIELTSPTGGMAGVMSVQDKKDLDEHTNILTWNEL